MRALRAASTVLVVGLSLFGATKDARADGDADAARTEARGFASQGDEAFAAGRCDRAVPLWKQAEARFHAPTLLFRIARCQVLLGHVVEAAATMDAIASENLAADAPAAWKDAQRDARTELPAVRARIATIDVVIDKRGIDADPTILIDGNGMPKGKTSFAVDPGSHPVRVTAADARWEQTVVLVDGEKKTVRVSMGLEQKPAPVTTQKLVGYVMGGAGMVSMAVGGFFGANALSVSHDLDKICGTDRKFCPSTSQPQQNQLKTDALVADLTIGFGAAVFIAGAVVIITAPKPKKEEPRLYFAPMGLGAQMGGRF